MSKQIIAVLLSVSLGQFSLGCKSEEQARPAADNTAVNDRDLTQGKVTAQDQSNTSSDVELTAKIRRSVVDDDSLSLNAHNVKIIVERGVVTLKGPVDTMQERDLVIRKAVAIVGEANVRNEIEVAGE